MKQKLVVTNLRFFDFLSYKTFEEGWAAYEIQQFYLKAFLNSYIVYLANSSHIAYLLEL